MLIKLQISNYLLIKELSFELSSSLNIFTGETGSGKSLIFNALKTLVTPVKDTDNLLLETTDTCFIEATFIITDISAFPTGLSAFLLPDNPTYAPTTITLSRRINSLGRTTNYINSQKATWTLFKRIGNHLLDFHLQNETSKTLSDQGSQLKLLDEYCQLDICLTSDYLMLFNEYEQLIKQINDITKALNQNDSDKEYINYQLQEFDKINWSPSIKEELEDQYQFLNNKKLTESQLGEVLNSLSVGELSVLSSLNTVIKKIANTSLSNLNPLCERLKSIYIELNDCQEEIYSELSNMEAMPEHLLLEVKNKLDIIYALEQKYKLYDPVELIQKRDELRLSLDSTETLKEQLASMQGNLKLLEPKVHRLARAISDKRVQAAKEFQHKLQQYMPMVGMAEGRIQIDVQELDFSHISKSGINNISFKFAPSQDLPLDDAAKICSGGELARLVLIIKGLIAQHRPSSKTLILDEIDTGISGAVAMKTGKLIEEFSKNIQIILITHIPQVASRAGRHYAVYKVDSNRVGLRLLKGRIERVNHIAAMISGEGELTSSAVNNASELLQQ